MQRVLDAHLAFLQFRLGGRADLDQGHAAGQLGDALVELLALVVAGQRLALLLDCGDAVANRLRIAGPADDRRAVLVDLHPPRVAQLLQRRLGERQAQLAGDHRAAGQHRHVLQHGLAAIAESGRLHRTGLDDAAHAVDDQRGERVGVHVFGDQQQRRPRLGDRLEQRHQLRDGGQLLVVQHDGRVLQHGRLLLGVVDEVGRQVAAVELHAFDHFQLAHQARAVLDRHRALAPDLVHRAGDQLADRAVVVGRDRRDMRDLLRGGGRLGDCLQLLHHRLDGQVDTALEVHRVHARGEVLQTFLDHRVGQHDGGGRPVAGHFAGARRDLAQQLCPMFSKRSSRSIAFATGARRCTARRPRRPRIEPARRVAALLA